MGYPKIQVAPYKMILPAGETSVSTDLHNIGTLKGFTLIFPLNEDTEGITATVKIVDHQGVDLFTSEPLLPGKHYVTPAGFVPCYERFTVEVEFSEPVDSDVTFESSIYIVF